MFVAGMSEVDAAIFGALSMFVAIFSAIKVFTWVATMYRGRVHFNTPMLYFFWFLFLFVFGGMTGVAVATQALDVHWHDTYFIVAHFHFIMVGGTLTAFLARQHYWFPKMFGRLYSERVGLLTSALGVPRLPAHLHPPVLAGQHGHAAALLQLSAPSTSASTCSPRAARTCSAVGLLLALVNLVGGAPLRGARGAEPLGLAHVRVGRRPRPRPSTTSPGRRSSIEAPTTTSSRRRRPMRAPHLYEQFEDLDKQAHAARLGMWAFLGSELLLFAGLFALYAGYRAMYPAEFAAAVGHDNIVIGTANTVVLITSSFTVAMSLHAVRSGHSRRAAGLLSFSIGCGLLFLVLKGLEYAQHFREGIAPGAMYRFAEFLPTSGARLFFTLYYLMTGLHGLHVVVGMGLLTWLAVWLLAAQLLARPLHPRRAGRALLAPRRRGVDLPLADALPHAPLIGARP